MLDLFNAISDLIHSDLVKDHVVLIVIVIMTIILLTSILTWLFCTKIYLHIKLNAADKAITQNEQLKERVDQLERDLKKKGDRLLQLEIMAGEANETFTDKALEKFVKK